MSDASVGRKGQKGTFKSVILIIGDIWGRSGPIRHTNQVNRDPDRGSHVDDS